MIRRRDHRVPDGAEADAALERAHRLPAPDAEHAARSQAELTRSLQRVIGNRATARLLRSNPTETAELARGRGSPELPGHPTAPHSPTVDRSGRLDPAPPAGPIRRNPSPALQREIQLEGSEVDLTKVFKVATDKKDQIILANWHWSTTVHNFTPSKGRTAAQKLFLAVAAARSQAADIPALFSAANLRFLTEDPSKGRLPTLYFQSGGNTGRIRQQHGSGPAVITETGKVDYFFSTKKKMKAFQKQAKRLKTKTKVDEAFAASDGTNTPTAGWAHLEIAYSGGSLTKTHPSGGLVDTNTGAYDDVRIGAIYQSVTGKST